MTKLVELSLTELASAIASGQASPVEALRASLARIEALDPTLRAFISVSEQSASDSARNAEREIANGRRIGSLHGVPIALKDNIGVRGETCSAGSKVLANGPPRADDAPLVARLRAAGAVFVGRLNMHELAAGVSTDNPHYGTARNPWNTEHTPGGSSGGAGAAVAARLVWGAIGTDTGCSVRLPAAYNGITGLRPTIGRVSNRGVVPLAYTLDTAGPLARTAEDTATLLQAISGYDELDNQSSDSRVPDFHHELHAGLAGMTIALIEDFSLAALGDDTRERMQDAVATLEGAGAIVRHVRLDDLDLAVSACLTINLVEPSCDHAALLKSRPEEYGRDVRALFEAGQFYLASHYVQAQRYRSLLGRRLSDLLQDVDALVVPTAPFTAPRVGASTAMLSQGIEADITEGAVRFNALASLGGLPGLSVPIGFGEDGLPLGLQFIGKAFDESTLLRLGHGFQQLTDWHTRSPSLG